ncbi:hypothetical protein TNCV_4791931 [Trichonephila clavipes]|nr:hypothetical protein TNCV_4791931 [Trichonephila clavipes]
MWPPITPVGSTASLSEQCRINIKFLVKFKKPAMKTFQILTEAYGNETLSYAYVFEWHKWFSGGRGSVEEDEPAGCTKSTITEQNIERIRDMTGFLLWVLPQTINQLYYIKILKRVKKLGKKYQNWGVMYGCCTKTMHPFPRPYLSSSFRPAKNITVMEHPPYSPDVAPCNFFIS